MANEESGSPLKGYVARAEALQREADEVAEAQRVLLAEVKGDGIDVKMFKKTLAVRRQDKAARAEHEVLLQLYLDMAEGA